MSNLYLLKDSVGYDDGSFKLEYFKNKDDLIQRLLEMLGEEVSLEVFK
jgi:hypothetical protein